MPFACKLDHYKCLCRLKPTGNKINFPDFDQKTLHLGWLHKTCNPEIKV